jgi:hypothetical protein
VWLRVSELSASFRELRHTALEGRHNGPLAVRLGMALTDPAFVDIDSSFPTPHFLLYRLVPLFPKVRLCFPLHVADRLLLPGCRSHCGVRLNVVCDC